MRVPESLKSRRLRHGRLGSIEQSEFGDIVLSLLRASGGQASRPEVLDAIHGTFKGQFTEADYALLRSQTPPKPRWVHNVDWAKRKLVTEGYLRRPSDSPYGVWVLTDRTRK